MIEAVNACGVEVVGLHAHAGSGIRSPDAWQHTAQHLINVARHFPHVRILDVGGGLGIVERPGQASLDLQRVDELLTKFKGVHPDVELWMEPGRFLVARRACSFLK